MIFRATLSETALGLNRRHARAIGKARASRTRPPAARRRPFLPACLLLTDRRRLPDPAGALNALPRGSAVILRHYGDPDREKLARRLVKLCHERGLLLLVAGDLGLARAVGADGVHLPEGLAHLARRARRTRPGWLVTAAAHDLPALIRSHRFGAHAALLSPVFPTPSHPGAKTLGSLSFAALARKSPLPVYALGGVVAATAPRLKGSGAIGIAAISGFSSS